MAGALPPVIVAGANPPPRLRRKLHAAGIELHADVGSTLPGLERAAIVFVPLRAGNTARFVVLEALAAGRPVVSTGSGVEGFALDPGSEVFIAQTADAFTSALVRLLRDPELRARASRFAAVAAEKHFDEPEAQERLAALFRE
jgi:glycosyltransferase involved in cell wall biosynthesis